MYMCYVYVLFYFHRRALGDITNKTPFTAKKEATKSQKKNNVNLSLKNTVGNQPISSVFVEKAYTIETKTLRKEKIEDGKRKNKSVLYILLIF